METQKVVLQEIMLKEFGWERFYKGLNPRGNLLLSDYRREEAAEMAKEEERKLEDIKDKVTTGQATIQAQTEHLYDVIQNLTDRKNEIREQEKQLELIKMDTESTVQKAQFAEELIDCFKSTNADDREKAYFEKMLDLRYENECLKRQNEELKAEN